MTPQKTKALIYCRVSAVKQKTEGHGLDSQEHRCREYANAKGYEVDQVFQDSITGGGDFMKRPAMRALLEYLDTQSSDRYVVIFDDLKRFARDTIFHLKLRQELNARNAKVECLNFTFEDTPEGNFVETILAAQGELERKQNRRQVIQKQKARLERGYWPFPSPPGYKTNKHPDHGKLMVPDEPKAGIVKQAYEGFASGRYPEQLNVQRFLQSNNFCDGRKVHFEKVKRLLTRPIYTGYIEHLKWGVSRRKGHHQPLISLSTYERVQEKLFGGEVRTRRDNSEDFPLRGFVLCSKCNRPCTASWSRGQGGRYPYYHCYTKECPERGKTLCQEDVHKRFKVLLKRVKPTENAVNLTMAACLERWDKRMDGQKDMRESKQNELKKVQEEIQNLALMAGKASNERVLKVYEDRIEKLSNRELTIQESIKRPEGSRGDFGTAVARVTEVLKNPHEYWVNGSLQQRRSLLKLIFRQKITYDKNLGFRTDDYAHIIKLFRLSETPNSQYVLSSGFEPEFRP